MTNNIQGEARQEKAMLMQVTVSNNDTLITARLLFLQMKWMSSDEADFRQQHLLQPKALILQFIIYHWKDVCFWLIFTRTDTVNVSCFYFLSSKLPEVAIFAQGLWTHFMAFLYYFISPFVFQRENISIDVWNDINK